MNDSEVYLVSIDVDRVLSRIHTVEEGEVALKLLPEMATDIIKKMETLSK